MNWCNEFLNRIEFDAPLARLTWFHIGGCAKILFHPSDAEDLALFLRRANQENIPLKILGSGANVLVSDEGFDGAVIRLDAKAFKTTQRDGERLTVGAGTDLMPLSKNCSQQGLAGLERMAGIPATVGGAVRMNAGGRFGDFGDVVESVELLTLEGDRQTWLKDRIGFDYRHTHLKDGIVLSATLKLEKDDPSIIRARYDEYFQIKQASQPMADKSAGCIFKNPKPNFAGQLIDQAGLKGLSQGGASVSTQHANFMVVQPNTRASDVMHLIKHVRQRVLDVCGIELETEIDIWQPVLTQEPAACP